MYRKLLGFLALFFAIFADAKVIIFNDNEGHYFSETTIISKHNVTFNIFYHESLDDTLLINNQPLQKPNGHFILNENFYITITSSILECFPQIYSISIAICMPSKKKVMNSYSSFIAERTMIQQINTNRFDLANTTIIISPEIRKISISIPYR